MKLDLLAFAAHPDDAELGCSGTLISHKNAGMKTGIADLTRGELGTRGSAEIRDAEAAKAAAVLGLDVRVNLGFKDGFFTNDEAHQLEVIKIIRAYKPEIILINSFEDRHPDHGRGSELVATSCFLAGLEKIITEHNGAVQEKWRPKQVYRYIQDHYHHPDLVVDVTGSWDQKMEAIMSYSSQFYDPNNPSKDNTPISSKEFIDFLEGRGREFGRKIGVDYGEGFNVVRPLGVRNFGELI